MTGSGGASRLGLAVFVALGLSACGNDPTINDNKATLGQLAGSILGRGGDGATAAPTLEQQAAQALASGNAPVLIATKDSGGSVLIGIGENGDYDHFGNSQREVMTFRHGVLTNTRGLGNDLMSADIAESLALIRGRRSGTAERRMRYLDGEDRTFTYVFECTVSVGGSDVHNSGFISTGVTTVTEDCATPSRTFRNTYKVDGSGEVLASSQWVAPMHGSLGFSLLRR